MEVKGKWEGKEYIVLIKNEILGSRNESEKYRLAVAVLGEHGARASRNFEPAFAQTATTFSLRRLLDAAGDPT